MNNDIMYHIGLSKQDINGAIYAILPGDPGRVKVIADKLSNSVALKVSREYTSYLGELNGNKVLVISTGMGGPSTAICVEELSKIGIKYLIRVGTSGGMQMDVMPGDLVIANSAIRCDGTSKEYVPVEYPAVASYKVTNALIKASEELGFTKHVGTVHSKDSFYGQHNPEDMPNGYELIHNWEAWIKEGALCSEMETSTLFIVSSYKRIDAGAVLTVIWNQERAKKNLEQNTNFDVDKEIMVAIKAIEILMRDGN